MKLENFDLSHVPVYIMDEETLSLYAVYMATLVALPNGRPCEDRIILKEFAKLREDAGLPKVVFRMCVVTSFYQRPAK